VNLPSQWRARVQPALSRSDTRCNWQHPRPSVIFDALVTDSGYSYYRIPLTQSIRTAVGKCPDIKLLVANGCRPMQPTVASTAFRGKNNQVGTFQKQQCCRICSKF